ncbi:MAG: AAA family ATPase, partial [Anaerolineae bacterium]|nr:AAA family ATPase [Anaerolineae bacterium]
MMQGPGPGPTSALPGRSSFVGRRAELGRLEAHLSAALTAGRGALVFLAGEAGVGKTALAREFAEMARARGAGVLWGACFEGEWQPAYAPWAEALRGYLRARHGERRRASLGPAAAILAALVPDLTSDLPETTAPERLGMGGDRLRLYDALTQFLAAEASAQCLLLVLDDLHWADEESLSLLRYLGRFVPRMPLLLLGIYSDPDLQLQRPHSLLEALGALRRQTDVDEMHLSRLERAQVSAYVATATDLRPSEALIDALMRETDGTPLYVRQLVDHWRERGQPQPGPLGAGDLVDLDVPASVREVVEHRLGHLSPDADAALQIAAAFPGGVRFVELRALVEMEEERLLDALDEAFGSGLIEASVDRPSVYRFAHEVVRRAVCDRQSPARQAQLQRRIAEALERVHAGRETEHAAEIAWHYGASASLPGAERGIPYALKAARRARAAYGPDRGVALLRLAERLAAWPIRVELRGEVQRELALALAEAMRWGQVMPAVEAAVDLG